MKEFKFNTYIAGIITGMLLLLILTAVKYNTVDKLIAPNYYNLFIVLIGFIGIIINLVVDLYEKEEIDRGNSRI